MCKKFILAGLLSVAILGISNAQKKNIASLGWSYFPNLEYERVLTEKSSVSLAATFFGAKTPSSAEIGEVANASVLTFVPQFRLYTSSKKEAPRGFYVAPYLKYRRLGLDASEGYNVGDPAQTIINTEGSFALTTLGAGVQLGVKWIIADWVAIDWYFLGLGVSSHTVKVDYSTDEVFPAGYGFSNLENEIKSSVADVPVIGDKVEVESTNNSLEMKVKNIVGPGFRSGFSIGITF